MTNKKPSESKYAPLGDYLAKKDAPHIPMTFAEIEAVVQNTLPASARSHRGFWSNNPTNSVITYAWLGAGYKTEKVDMATERLVFRKDTSTGQPTPADQQGVAPTGDHPAFGCLQGTIQLADNVDLTSPAAPGWAADLTEKTA